MSNDKKSNLKKLKVMKGFTKNEYTFEFHEMGFTQNGNVMLLYRDGHIVATVCADKCITEVIDYYVSPTP